MKNGIKITSGLIVVLIATVVASVAVLKSTDYNQFKGQLDRLVQDATGREFSIAGDLDLAISLNPTLSVSDVTFANADWGQDTPMIKLKRLDARVALKPLLFGRLDVDYIVLDGLDLVLETDGKGKANWEFSSSTPPSSKRISDGTLALDPRVGDVRLRNVHLTYRDGATGAVLKTDLKRADFKAADLDSPLNGVLEAVYNGVEFEATTKLGSLAQLIGTEGDPFPIHLKITGDDLNAEIVGTVDQPSAGMAVDVRVNVKANDTATLSKLASVDLPKLSGVAVRADISGRGATYLLNGVEAKFGPNDVAGSAEIDLSAKRPRVSAKLDAQYLDANALMGMTAPQTQKADRVFSTAPLALDALKRMDGDVRLNVKRTSVDVLELSNTQIHAKLKDGKLTLAPVQTTIDGGRIAARVTLDGSNKTPKVSVRASVRGLDVDKVAALVGHGGLVSLKVDGEVNVKGSGSSAQLIMGGLSGSTNWVGRKGQIHDELFKDLTEGIGSILPWASNKDANAISCVIAKVPIEKGVATAQTALLDTSGVRVKVTGNVDLNGELLHLTVHTDAKKASLASFAVPVRIKGPFLKPRIDVDPGEAVIGTVANIVKAPAELIGGLLKDTIALVESDKEKKEAAAKDDPCIQALSRGKTSAKASPEDEAKTKSAPPPQDKPTDKGPAGKDSTGKEPVDKSKSTGDPLKDAEIFGDAIKNLF